MKLRKSLWKRLKEFIRVEESTYEQFIEDEPIRETELKKKPKLKVCSVRGCQKKLNQINGFRCNYCSNYVCAEHRLPEEHKCKAQLTVPRGIRMGTDIECWDFSKV